MTDAISAKARQVRDYYDANTARFELLGQGRATGAVHRAVWGEGVESRDAAFEYPNELVLREYAELSRELGRALRVLDLGCGVGGSLLFLAARTPITGTGVTVSSAQAARASQSVRTAGLEGRIAILQADFLSLPEELPQAHLAYAIEAFVHASDPEAFFAAAARQVVRGGVLIVCDDFLCPHQPSLSRRDRRIVDRVRDGWLANSLVTLSDAHAHAERAGFRLTKSMNLTPHLELGRPRDRFVRAMLAAFGSLPIPGMAWRSLVGGNALQAALLSGLIEFRFVVWRRAS
ncbi:MAG TPA: methyltransferase domain-containing protein [Polyangiaceae bacterium]|nr:methyltransferase domain-containing protein [Polyangiaceae bacterium]